MSYDIIFITGDKHFDHPFCATAILKRLLEKHGYSVGVIEKPKTSHEIKKLGKPELFFAVSSGGIDSMVRNYTPLKKKRELDYVPDRAVIVYSNWIKQNYKDAKIVLGGTESSLRRFVHYDYWDNKLRKPVIFDARADIIAYGNAEKQILIIADKIKKNEPLHYIPGTCIIQKTKPKEFVELPSFNELIESKEKFCDMHNIISNKKNLAQKIDNRFILQFKSPIYTTKDLDEYNEMPYSRKAPAEMEGFTFSIVTHRGCIGDCNFCSIRLTQGNKIISRSEESILREIKRITKMPHFKGNIDNLAGPSAEMYGMDCHLCNKACIDCSKLDKSNKAYIKLLKKARNTKGVKNVFIRTGIRHDLCSRELLKEIASHHVSGQLRIAPEHVNRYILNLMNKDRGNYKEFLREFRKYNRKDKLSFYFMTAHPGSGFKEAKELARELKKLECSEDVQVFTPTPLTTSTCMYYTGMEPKTKKKIHVPYTYREKKLQKRVLFE
ncbi:MAG: YgiQ family radical SAM protein [Candidatus Nanoarchaeia archaeon]